MVVSVASLIKGGGTEFGLVEEISVVETDKIAKKLLATKIT
jgi:hypothetical protein